MDWFVEIAVLLIALIVGLLGNRRRNKKLFEARSPQSLHTAALDPGPQTLEGHPIRQELLYCSESNGEFVGGSHHGNQEALYIQRTTIVGLLPTRVTLGWTPNEKDEQLDRADLWLPILFSPQALGQLPPGGTLFARDGDLIFETKPKVRPSGGKKLLAVARAYLDRAPIAIDEALLSQVKGPRPQLALLALEEMLRSAPDATETQEAMRWALGGDSDALFCTAAAADYERNRAKVLQIADRGEHHARILALKLLLKKKDRDGLRSISQHPVPAQIAADYLGAIRDLKDRSMSVHIVGYLDHSKASIVEAAADALATCGALDAIEGLKNRMKRGGLSPEAKTSIEVAIELIQDHAPRNAQGGLSVVSPLGSGRLSVASGGELSPPQPIEDPGA